MGCICESLDYKKFDMQITAKNIGERETSAVIKNDPLADPLQPEGRDMDEAHARVDAPEVKQVKISLVEEKANPKEEITSPKTTARTSGKETEFKYQLFNYINQIRTNPAQFAKVIDKYIPYIKKGSNGQILDKPGSTTIPINLLKGIDTFKECQVFLMGLHKLLPLTYKEELELPISQNPKSWINRTEIAKMTESKRLELQDQYSFFTINFDINTKDPELSAVNQLVDDSNLKGQRRSNILSHAFKYVGISNSPEIDKQCVVFVHFAY